MKMMMMKVTKTVIHDEHEYNDDDNDDHDDCGDDDDADDHDNGDEDDNDDGHDDGDDCDHDVVIMMTTKWCDVDRCGVTSNTDEIGARHSWCIKNGWAWLAL